MLGRKTFPKAIIRAIAAAARPSKINPNIILGIKSKIYLIIGYLVGVL
jgi:hypothetical protein